MSDDEKPPQTPREMIAKLHAMTPEEFNRFMMWNFNRICSEPRIFDTETDSRKEDNG